MNIRISCLAIALMGMLPLSSAYAVINGLVNAPRVFNDHPTSTLTMVNSNSVNPGSASINDVFTEGLGGANRHDVLLSSNNGVSAHSFNIADKFTVKAEVKLTDGTNAPRKEAGLRINSPVTGDVLFIINSDAGEIVAFGGGAPFHLFGNNGGGNGYTPGSTILMGFTYKGNMGMGPATINYFIDRDVLNPGGEASSGPMAFSNLELGAVNFNVAMYAQGQSSGAGDFVNATFNNIMFIPEPATIMMSLIALGGMALIRRRVR